METFFTGADVVAKHNRGICIFELKVDRAAKLF